MRPAAGHGSSGAPLASNDDSLIFVAKVLAAGETLPN